MNKLLASLLLALLVSPALSATTRYICDCSLTYGASAQCLPGNDNSLDPTNPATPWQSISKSVAAAQTQAAGDRYRYCRDGAWAPTGSFNWANGTSTSTATNPVVFDDYVGSWGVGVNRPLMNFTGSAFFLSSYNQHNGITIRNLDLRGPRNLVDTFGVQVYGAHAFVIVDNVNIQGFHFGFTSAQDGAGVLSHDIIVRNSQFVSNRNSGGFIATKRTAFIGNSFFDNGNCFGGVSNGNGNVGPQGCQNEVQRHSLYVGGSADGEVYDVSIIGNTSTHASYFNGTCEGTHFTGHGVIKRMKVSGNTVVETSAAGTCYGIGYGDNYGQTGEGCQDCDWDHNTVANAGQYPLTVNASPGARIWDNDIICTTSNVGGAALRIDIKNRTGSLDGGNYKIFGNTVWAGSGCALAGISFNGSGTGTGHLIANNLIRMGTGSSGACFSMGGKPLSDFGGGWTKNLCRMEGSGSISAPSGAEAALTGDPQFVATPSAANGWNLAIGSTSAARDVGSNTYCAITDKLQLARDALCDIGSHEYGASAATLPPLTPINVR